MSFAERILRPSRPWVFFTSVFAVLNAIQGLGAEPSPWGWPHYAITYEHGFIRRGLVGTLFQAVARELDPAYQKHLAHAVHNVVTTVVLAMLAWLAYRSQEGATRRVQTLVFVGVSSMFLSKLPAALYANSGYLDPYLVGLTGLAGWLISQGRRWEALCLGLIAPFVHDAALFLWLPILVLAVQRIVFDDDRRAAIKRELPLLLPVVVTLLVQRLHSPSAARAALEAVPMAPGDRESFLLYQFGLTVPRALELMFNGAQKQVPNALLSCAFFLPPALVAATCAVFVLPQRRALPRVLFAFAATLAPCSVLLVAWDLWRFLLWASFGALLVLFDAASTVRTEAPTTPSSMSVRGSLVSFATLLMIVHLSTAPYVAAYFEMAGAPPQLTLSVFRALPATKLTYAYLRRYNRRQYVDHFSSRERCSVANERAEKIQPCSWHLSPAGNVDTEDVRLPAGDYTATVVYSREGCGDADAFMQSRQIWRYGHLGQLVKLGPSETRASVAIHVSDEEAVMSSVAVRVWATSSCLRVDELRIDPEH